MTALDGDAMRAESPKRADSRPAAQNVTTKAAPQTPKSSNLSPQDQGKSPAQTSQNEEGGSQAQSPSSPLQSRRLPLQMEEPSEHSNRDEWAEFSDAWKTNIASPGRKVLLDFFYPPRQQLNTEQSNRGKESRNDARNVAQENTNNGNHQETPPPPQPPLPPTRQTSRPPTPGSLDEDPQLLEQEREDRAYVERFWTAYDDIIIISLFTQVGILCRLGAAYWFRMFSNVFRNDRALFTNLPLNCLSCFVMGLLCSGESLMQIISTRFTPPRLQQDLHKQAHQAYEDSGEGPEEFRLSSPVESTSSGSRWRGRLRRRRRKRKRNARKRNWKPNNANMQNELREVQLLALERRIRASPCLVLFPVKKQDVDVVEDYFNDGYQRGDRVQEEEEKREEKNEREEASCSDGNSAFSFDDHDLSLDEEGGWNDLLLKEEVEPKPPQAARAHIGAIHGTDGDSKSGRASAVVAATLSPISATSPGSQSNVLDVPAKKTSVPSTAVNASDENVDNFSDENVEDPVENGHTRNGAAGRAYPGARNYTQVAVSNDVDYGTADYPDFDQIISNVTTDVSQKISRISRANLADGWDLHTTPEEKTEDFLMGLREGLCGALSSFSSWISSMVGLFKEGQFGEAFVGLLLGIQLPLLAYRFGQHVAVYIFVFRCRRETRRDERRGYGIRLATDEDMSNDGNNLAGSIHSPGSGDALSQNDPRSKEDDSQLPSVRAILTALFIMSLVAQVTSLNFFYQPEDRLVAMSLLFSPLGVLARWRLSKFNSWRPSFPIGTFACNIGACALSGTLGSILAGNPDQSERIALVAIIAGFGGTLSSVARFIVEVLAGMDPILFRMDGAYYAICSVFWGLLVSFFFAASVDWADSVE